MCAFTVACNTRDCFLLFLKRAIAGYHWKSLMHKSDALNAGLYVRKAAARHCLCTALYAFPFLADALLFWRDFVSPFVTLL